jgi:hypothetical protein
MRVSTSFSQNYFPACSVEPDFADSAPVVSAEKTAPDFAIMFRSGR